MADGSNYRLNKKPLVIDLPGERVHEVNSRRDTLAGLGITSVQKFSQIPSAELENAVSDALSSGSRDEPVKMTGDDSKVKSPIATSDENAKANVPQQRGVEKTEPIDAKDIEFVGGDLPSYVIVNGNVDRKGPENNKIAMLPTLPVFSGDVDLKAARSQLLTALLQRPLKNHVKPKASEATKEIPENYSIFHCVIGGEKTVGFVIGSRITREGDFVTLEILKDGNLASFSVKKDEFWGYEIEEVGRKFSSGIEEGVEELIRLKAEATEATIEATIDEGDELDFDITVEGVEGVEGDELDFDITVEGVEGDELDFDITVEEFDEVG